MLHLLTTVYQHVISLLMNLPKKINPEILSLNTIRKTVLALDTCF